MLKDDILKYLSEKTEAFIKGQENENYTSQAISEVFKVKRNTISHYLNQMVESEEIIKVNTRPVYFFHRDTFERKFFKVSGCVYESFEQLFQEEPKNIDFNIFDELIGSDGSLKKAIEQIRTSIFYPDNGLPLMLSGPTGVGKSYMAKLIHSFSVRSGVLKEDAPFIMFNCAQYYNNPELLSSNLFGYVKGAFTGAEQTRPGMLEEADGGILFLDEVHRLNEEGQEKLFTFMDQGVFRRIGESSGWHKAKVRLIFATTEALNETFLETFLRRVPIFISIPGLDERGEEEKLQFIYSFLINEAKTFNREICISKRTIDKILSYNFKGNVGELINLVKYICAKAYSRNINSGKIEIKLYDFPEKILKYSMELSDTKIINKDEIIITPATTVAQLYKKEKTKLEIIKNMFKEIFSLYEDLKINKISSEAFETSTFHEIYTLIDKLVFDKLDSSDNIMMQLMTSGIQEIFKYLEISYNIKFNGNSVYAIAHYLYAKNYGRLHWSKETLKRCEQLYNYTIINYKEQHMLVKVLMNIIASKMDVGLTKEDEIFFSFYLKSLEINSQKNLAKGVILAHGYATASSIANVVNRMLQINVFEPFDMPIDSPVSEIVSKLNEYIEKNDVSKGLVILVDTGSLKDIHSNIKEHINGPVAIVNNVSTQMALYVGDMLRRDVYLEELVSKLKDSIETQYKVIYPVRADKPKTIVTTCISGIGAARKLQKLLEVSIPKELGIKIIVHDYRRLKTDEAIEALLQTYDVLAVLGTTDPEVEQLRFISLEDLISGRGEDKLHKIFENIADNDTIEKINNNIVRNFSLESVVGSLTILDTNRILEHTEEFINNLEVSANRRLPNDRKVALYVHVSCLVERLIRQEPIEDYPDIERFTQCQKNEINNIRNAFSVIEDIYNVKINTEEIGYIYDIISAKASNMNEDL